MQGEVLYLRSVGLVSRPDVKFVTLSNCVAVAVDGSVARRNAGRRNAAKMLSITGEWKLHLERSCGGNARSG